MESAKVEEQKVGNKDEMKSSEVTKTSPVEAEANELAPDLNGEKQTELETTVVPMEEDSGTKEAKEPEEAPKPEPQPQGRKRKAFEMKNYEPVTQPIAETQNNAEATPETVAKVDEPPLETSLSAKPGDTPETSIRKGKRARIPNKRYDVTITSGGFPGFPKQPLNSSNSKYVTEELTKLQMEIENGEITGNLNSEVTIQSIPSTPTSASISAPVQISTPVSLSRKKTKSTVDLSNPAYLKPFEYGWRRELVFRGTVDGNFRKNGDIYYYTPTGKKVRSMREVGENLKEKALTLENFTFFKEPLGIGDPEKEIIRDAKWKGAPGSAKKLKVGKLPKNSKTPKEKILSPKPTSGSSTPKSPVTTPKAVKQPNSGLKVKLPPKSKPTSATKSKVQKKSNKSNVENYEVVSGMLPPNYTSPSPPKKTPARSSTRPSGDVEKPWQPCSTRCLGVAGQVPSLQCRLCLCLYHNKCVGVSSLESNTGGYVCKNCQLDNQDPSTSLSDVNPSAICPSSLTSINPSNNTQSILMPSLPLFPRTEEVQQNALNINIDHTNNINTQNISNITRFTPPTEISCNVSESKNIVGSVTTWFPPSSQIQLGNPSFSQANENNLISAPRPQYVEYLGNRKFLVIPKHNVLSFSPTIATAANTPIPRTAVNSDKCPEDSNLTADVPDVDSASCPNSTQLSKSSSLTNFPSLPPTFPDPHAVNQISTEPEQIAGKQDITETAMDIDTANMNEIAKPTPKAKKSMLKPIIPSDKSEEGRFMDNYLQNLAFGYNTLLYVFQHLKVQDLLRAGCVCSMWRDVSRHSSLWKTVRMKNSQIHNFEGLADALEKYGTVNLDLRKMLVPTNTNPHTGGDERIWPSFSKAIAKATSLRRIELCRCPAKVIENLAESNPLLEVINAVTIKCDTMNLSPMSSLKNLQELRLKSTSGFTLTSDLSALKDLKNLKVLSLTSIKDLHKINIEVIGELEYLESLDLGECTDFPESFGTEILPKLKKLEKLRLEKGQGTCCTFEILKAVKNIKHLEQLELVNFDIKSGFDVELGACTNIKKLLIIPTYISQSATTNHMVLGGVLRLQSTLSQFVWGVTLELLRVTELFVDQCDQDKDKKKEKKPTGKGDSIPVLKPVPLLTVGSNEISPAEDPPQVEILPLPTLQKLLLQNLPTTRVKILKIPFHATWRQSIVDTVN